MDQRISNIINQYRFDRLKELITRYGPFYTNWYSSSRISEEYSILTVEYNTLITIFRLPKQTILTIDHLDWIKNNKISLPLNEEDNVLFELTWS